MTSETAISLNYLEPGTLFRDRDSLWQVCNPTEEAQENGNICARRIANWNVNNTGELMFKTPNENGYEHYNGCNEAVLVAGIYEVIDGALESPLHHCEP